MEAKQKEKMDLLTAIEQIVEKAKDSKLSPEFYLKALFDEYREIVGRSEKTPILLFNEADAIINKR